MNPPADDAALLRRYVAENSDAAFAELVERQIPFVYACALRRVGGDAHLARDVTQQVFIAVARRALELSTHPVLSGWLYVATKNATAHLVRGERRRQVREQKAHAMNDLTPDPDAALDWSQLRDVIDPGLDELESDDRQAVLLRFFEGKTFAEIGAGLRLTENAARMRVERALDKLHAALSRRGITSTAAALGLALAQRPAVALPSGLAAGVTGAVLAGVGAGAGGLAVAKTGLLLASAAALTVTGWIGWSQHRANRALQAEIDALKPTLAAMARVQTDNRTLANQVAEIAAMRGDDAELERLGKLAEDLRRSERKAGLAGLPEVRPPSAPPASISIQGQVVKPGEFAADAPITLSQLVAQAGGLASAASERIRITRPKVGGSIAFFEADIRHPEDMILQPGDVVYVPEKISAGPTSGR